MTDRERVACILRREAADGAPIEADAVGGGAGGLELATRLGNRHDKRGRAQIELIDKSRTHLWKSLL